MLTGLSNSKYKERRKSEEKKKETKEKRGSTDLYEQLTKGVSQLSFESKFVASHTYHAIH